MKINHLKIEDCQRLKLFEITPDKNLIIIGGNNAQGKTSVLESIKMLVGGKRAQVSEAVRHGAEEANIVAVTDTGLTISKKISTDGKERLKITGPRDSNGQTFLNSIYNKQTIDPLAFSLFDKATQRETLLKLVGVDPTQIDREIKDLKEERTDVNRKLKDLTAQVNNAPHYPDTADEEVSVGELVSEINKVNELVVAHQAKKNRLQVLKEEKAKLKARLEEIDNEGRGLSNELKAMAVPDISELQNKLTEIEQYNQKARANVHYKTIKEQQGQVGKEANKLTTQIEGLREQKKDLLKTAKFPVSGLSFDEEQVLYNGIPFEQASGAEKLRVSTAIGIALQPELRVLLIRDGSLLDDNNLAMLNQMAEEHDAQIWLERVGHDEQASVIIEDGLVKDDRTGRHDTANLQGHERNGVPEGGR